MSTEKLFERSNNHRMIRRYVSLVESISKRDRPPENFHKHHILPKAKDMFPEYSSFADHPWNELKVSLREHYLLHWMLAKAFPGTSQSRCFYYMCNTLSKRKSRDYEKAKLVHLENMKGMYTEERNKKISNALKGKAKSETHRQKLIGHVVTDSTRQKLRVANLGKKATQESRDKMSATRLGQKRSPHSECSKSNISAAKKQAGLKWYNDGTQSKLFGVCPEGWSKGRLRWK